VWAFKSFGTIGGVAGLRVATEAKAKYTSFTVTIQGKRGPIAKLVSHVATRGLIQEVGWRVPRAIAPQTLRFRVVGQSATGSTSAPSWANLRLTKPRPSSSKTTR
jgi:hypothetical protein